MSYRESYKDEALIASYEPEGHEIAIKEAQSRGDLTLRFWQYWGIRRKIELKLKWYIFRGGAVSVLAIDCNPHRIKGLHKGDLLAEIYAPGSRPDIAFGRPDYLVAAILNTEYEPVYKAPAFNLEEFRVTHILPILPNF